MPAMRRSRFDLRRLAQSRCVHAFVLALIIGAGFAHAAPLNANEPVRQHTKDRECEWYWLERYLHWQRVSRWELQLYPGYYEPDPSDLRVAMYAHNEAVRAWSYRHKCRGDDTEAAESIATYNSNRDLFVKSFGRYGRYHGSRDAARDFTYCTSCENSSSIEDLLRKPDVVIVRGSVRETTPKVCQHGALCIGLVHTTVSVRELWLGALPPDTEHDRISVVLYDTWWWNDRRPWLEPGEEVVLILQPSRFILNPPNKYPLYQIVEDRYGYFLLEGDRLRHGVLQDPSDPAHRGHPDWVHPLSVFAQSVDTSKLKAAFVGGANARPHAND